MNSEALQKVLLDGETKVFFVVGDPIGQVKSPRYLTALAQARGVNAVVVPAHVPPDAFSAFIDICSQMQNVEGLAVTVPHKYAAYAKCDRLGDRARMAGSVNVMRKEGGASWFGDNTDGTGFVSAAIAKGYDLAGKHALLVGCGGAGAAIACEILARGAAWLSIYDVDKDRAGRLFSVLQENFGDRVGMGSADPSGFDFVANATPLGMSPNDPDPIETGKLVESQFCGCVITRPEVSPWLAEARRKQCRTINGADMFDAQAGFLVDHLLGHQANDRAA